jgi:uncharacterized protein (DUF433 family)
MDYLEAGDSLDLFLDDFPTVTREQVIEISIRPVAACGKNRSVTVAAL